MSPANAIVGHRKQLLQLMQDLETGNISHTYLFAGSPHLGKMTVAHWFARELLTRDMEGEERARTLQQMDRLIHPDLLVLDQLWLADQSEDWDVIAQSSNVPQEHRAKAKLKTDIIGVDDVREIQVRLQETGVLSHRVCIIRGIERMTPSAANALLKILEEPPARRIFILTADNKNLVLPTVISRARVLHFERVGDRDIQALMQEGITEEDASFIVHIAQGEPAVAIRLMNDPDALREEKALHAHAVSFWGSPKAYDRLKQLSSLETRGKKADRFLFHLALALRELPEYTRAQERALQNLTSGLKTNAHRVLQMQEFAFASETKNEQ